VLQRDDDGVDLLETEDLESDELVQRNALLSSWSPPDSITPIAAVAGAPNEGILDLPLNMGLDDLADTDSNYNSNGGERDSGIHVGDHTEELPKLEL
jgi:hypothetical protein